MAENAQIVGQRTSMVNQLKRELFRPKKLAEDFLTIGPVAKGRYGISQRLQSLSKPKALERKEMTEEQLEKEREREKMIAERKARYKKFDFADFVNREDAFEKQQEEKKKKEDAENK